MSLVNTPSNQLATCAACGSNRVTEISMTLTDGSPVSFTSCRRCEHKSWRHTDGQLPVETVLAKAQKHKPAGK